MPRYTMTQRMLVTLCLGLCLVVSVACPAKKSAPLDQRKAASQRDTKASTRPASRPALQNKVLVAKKPKPEYTPKWALSDQERKDMDAWQMRFAGQAFNPCLKQYRIKICCRPGCCEGMRSVVRIALDAKSRISSFQQTKPFHCSQVRENSISLKRLQRAEACYLKRFKKMTFPASLKGRKLELVLGWGYGC